jgi:hypothetical protein
VRPEFFAEQEGEAGAAGGVEEFALVHKEKMPVPWKKVQITLTVPPVTLPRAAASGNSD